MSKEITQTKPTVGQMIRSSIPYLYFLNKKHKGQVEVLKTPNGDMYFAYLPPGYKASSEKFPVLYHLHGAGMFWNWLKHDVHWVTAQHEKAVEMGVSEPMIIIFPFDSTKFSLWTDSKDGKAKKATMVIDGRKNRCRNQSQSKNRSRLKISSGVFHGWIWSFYAWSETSRVIRYNCRHGWRSS